MADRIRQLDDDSDESSRLQRAVTTAAELIGGCSHAGITVVQKQGVSTAAATDEVALAGDRLQYELDEGPCLDSIRQETTVVSNDLAVDGRWPAWAPAAHRQLGVSAMASLLLFHDDRSFGALNLYGQQRQAFDDDDLAVARALATHIGLVMASRREIDHLKVALDSRTEIGQAQGILMERYGLDAAGAFALLRRLSQHHNRKLSSIAGDLVSTRQLDVSI